MKPITDYELIDHGIESSDYFRGCGVAFTEFVDVVTGIGGDIAEAIGDCLEQLACGGDWDVEGLNERMLADNPHASGRKRKQWPTRPVARGEMYYHVSIRVR